MAYKHKALRDQIEVAIQRMRENIERNAALGKNIGRAGRSSARRLLDMPPVKPVSPIFEDRTDEDEDENA